MIKAIILDVDGIIVGEKIGFNSPHPHTDVLKKLKDIHSKGIPIVLCTGKPYYAIPEIIKGACLNNPHITDAGGMIIDPIDSIVVQKYIIEKGLAKEVIETCVKNDVYVEFYTQEYYFVQENQVSDITKQHEHILQQEPKVVVSLSNESVLHDITKIMPIALNENDKKRVDGILEKYKNKLSVSWGIHPIALPLQFAIITVLGCSKKEAAEQVIRNLHLTFNDVLGIGDSTSDWSFIQLCGYGASVKNGSDELKELIKTKGEGRYTIGKSVDENGILDVFNFFNL